MILLTLVDAAAFESVDDHSCDSGDTSEVSCLPVEYSVGARTDVIEG